MTSGTFLVNVKASGYLELTKTVEVTKSERTFFLAVTPQPQTYNVIRLQAVDALTGETIRGVYFELARERDQLPEEGLSDTKGCYEFAIINTGSYLVKTRKAGYIAASKVYHVKPSMLTSSKENFFSLTIPLLKNNL